MKTVSVEPAACTPLKHGFISHERLAPLALLFMLSCFTGCASKSTIIPEATAAVSPAETSLGIDGPAMVSAGSVARYSLTSALSPSTAVTWSLQSTSGTTNLGSIAQDGTYQAPASLPANLSLTIIASAPNYTSASFPVSLETTVSGGKTYYVDSAAGNDSHAGTSASTPWKTIQKVNQSVFQPGDSVLFMRGDSWAQTLHVPSSGTAAKPITFGAYGNGNLPIIDTSTVVTQWTAEHEGSFTTYYTPLSTESYMVTANGNFLWADVVPSAALAVSFLPPSQLAPGKFAWDSIRGRLYVRLTGDQNPADQLMKVAQGPYTILVDGKSHIRLNNLQVSGGNYNCIRAVDQADDLQIVGNTVENCGFEGNQASIFLDGARETVIQDNIIAFGGNQGVNFSGYNGGISDNGLVSNNKVSNMGYDCIAFGPVLNGSVAGGIAEYNDVSYCGQTRIDSAGIDSYQPGQGIIYRYNRVHNGGTSVSYSAGVRFDSGSRNESAYGNLVYLNSSGCVQFGGSQIAFYNNTCYHNNELAAYDYGELNFFVDGQTGPSTYIKAVNNILVPSADKQVVTVNQGCTKLQTIDRNLYATDATSAAFSWGGKVYDFADWKKQASQDATSPNPADPQFKSPASFDFSLLATSPALDIATPMTGYSLDLVSTPVPQGPGPDLGSYELPYSKQ